MSRRHHHHTMQPYDYERFVEPPRERDQTRGIEYQDDSLSSINSDEESYLHHSHVNKDKKQAGYFPPKAEPQCKPNKTDKSTNVEEFYQKNSKNQPHTTNSESSSTVERLGRLENMLEELLKRNSNQTAREPAKATPPPEKKTTEKKEGQYCLDPKRHDFTTSMWINKIQEISIQNNWSEKNIIQYMGTQMSGIVKAWYKSLPNYDYTWPEWKILISKIFPDNTDFVTTLKRLVTRLKQADESITTYYFSKMYLIEACKITGEDAVSCVIDGLNNQEIQEQAKARNFLTPETLYSQFLSVLPDYTVDYSPSIQPTTESVINSWYYQEREPPPIEEELPEMPVMPVAQPEFIQYDQGPRNDDFDYGNQGNSGFNEEGRPYSMKSPLKRAAPVHSRLDTRFIKPNNFRKHNKIPMAAKVCSICGNRGHLAKQCRNANNIMYFTMFGDEVGNCFYVDCTVNRQKLKGFIDTGCTTVTVKEEVVRSLDVEIEPSSNFIRAYGGSLVQVLGEVEIDLDVDSIKARVRAVVVPNHVQEMSVIIGQSFLTQKNVTMIMKNSTITLFEASTRKLTE